MQNRVVVTGMGVQTPLGATVEEFFRRLCAGETGVRRHPNPAIKYPVSWVPFDANYYFSKLQLMNLDRVSQLAIVAATDAARNAGYEDGIDFGDACGVYLGTARGGVESTAQAYVRYFGAGNDQLKSLTMPSALNHAPASQIAMSLGVHGECQTYSTSCSSASVAIGEAYRRIKHGYMESAIAGGADSVLTPGVINGWAALNLLVPIGAEAKFGSEGTGCRPFSFDRCGFSIGEGAAVFVLESLKKAISRGAVPIAEIVGYGVSNDTSPMTKPDKVGQATAMRLALKDAKLSPKHIGYINAHGTATTAGDVAETQSIKAVFGNHAYFVPVSSTKSAHGHLMGATGAVELAATVMALKHQIVPPTTHFSGPDKDCDLDYVPHKSRVVNGLEFALSNSFAFGGNNAVLIAKKWQ